MKKGLKIWFIIHDTLLLPCALMSVYRLMGLLSVEEVFWAAMSV